EGVVTRTVADTAAVLDVLAGPDLRSWYNAPAPDRPFRDEVGADVGKLRVALMDKGPSGMPTDPDCSEAAQRTANALEEMGHSIETVELPTISEELTDPFNLMVAAGLGEHLDEMDWDQVEPHIAYQWGAANHVPSAHYVFAMKLMERLSRELVEPFVSDFDVLVTPTTAVTAPPVGALLEAAHTNPEAPSETL